MPKISSSCDPNVQHIIYDHEEVIPYYDNVYLKLVYVKKEGFEGNLIGVHACEKDGTLIKQGLIVVLENGVWVRQPNLNKTRLSFISVDELGRIQIAN